MIYVVEGRTGEYSDRSEWIVCYRVSREDAERVRVVCQEQADAWFEKYKNSPGYPDADDAEEAKGWMLDPWFGCDYTGTQYVVIEVPEDPLEAWVSRIIAEPGLRLNHHVACEHCRAAVGEHCRYPSGRLAFTHRQRHRSAQAICPRCTRVRTHRPAPPGPLCGQCRARQKVKETP